MTVWAAVSFDKGIVFRTMINQTMNGERYRETRENYLLPFIEEHHTFQHDGAPAHFSCVAREWLDSKLLWRWIGRRGFREWPARSPDLMICDFWLWSHVKNQVFRQDYQTLLICLVPPRLISCQHSTKDDWSMLPWVCKALQLVCWTWGKCVWTPALKFVFSMSANDLNFLCNFITNICSCEFKVTV